MSGKWKAEASSSKRSVNSYGYTARNLRKTDLAGVIFGCKNHTFDECLGKQLFGLPAVHFSYVQKIDPGLPLFLFNYSDRTLHGIFESAGPGMLNIDQYAWLEEGVDRTPYPAQVKVKNVLVCQPLAEYQFKAIIMENYYGNAGPNHFWFELDRSQTEKLLSEFSASPVKTGVSLPKQLPYVNSLRKASEVSALGKRKEGDQHQTQNATLSTEFLGFTADGETGFVPPKPWAALFKRGSTTETGNKAESLEMSGSDSRKPWAALFKSETSSDVKNEPEEDVLMPCSEWGSYPVDQSDMGWNTSGYADEPLESGWYRTEMDISTTYTGTLPCAGTRHELEDSRYVADNSSTGRSTSCVSADLDGDVNRLEVPIDKDGGNAHELEQVDNNTVGISSTYQSVDEESFSEGPSEEDSRTVRSKEKDKDVLGGMIVSETHSSDGCSISQLLTRLKDLEFHQLMQDKKISSLEQELVRSKLQIQQLKRVHQVVESAVFPAIQLTEESDDEIDATSTKLDELVLVAGGFNGSSWLADLDAYSFSEDTMKPLNPMKSVRRYASAAKFNSELHLIGGLCESGFSDQVESYNLATDQWTVHPSLNQRKASLAGISLDSKIFAMGGGNENGCFAEVEMFDADAGRWIFAQSMLQKRFSPAAGEINGILYVVGGYDGRSYLNSVERFDPREHYWTRLQDMNTRRSCLCMAVLNEKLYAFGGYDGSSMVATMEVLDPRFGSWINKESMNSARGYFGAVVLGDAIYAIGGLSKDEELPDTVEYYREGQGWKVSNLKGVGTRCFQSTILF